MGFAEEDILMKGDFVSAKKKVVIFVNRGRFMHSNKLIPEKVVSFSIQANTKLILLLLLNNTIKKQLIIRYD